VKLPRSVMLWLLTLALRAKADVTKGVRRVGWNWLGLGLGFLEWIDSWREQQPFPGLPTKVKPASESSCSLVWVVTTANHHPIYIELSLEPHVIAPAMSWLLVTRGCDLDGPLPLSANSIIYNSVYKWSTKKKPYEPCWLHFFYYACAPHHWCVGFF
jgi:hypothetical protein